MPDTENVQTAARPRYQVCGERKIAVMVEGNSGSETSEIEGTLVELSADGARLALSEPLEFQDQLWLQLGEEFGLAEPVAAEVRWCQRAHRNKHLVGCAFAAHLPEELLEELLADGILNRDEPARHGVSGEADGWRELNPTALHVRLVDLSRGGLSVISPQPAKIGQRLRLVFQEADQEPVEILGNIRWQGETTEGYLLGCQFEHDEYYHRIRDLVCPGGGHGTNGPTRQVRRRGPSDRGLGWFKRLWKQKEEDLVVSASLRDLMALTRSAEGESNMAASNSHEGAPFHEDLDQSEPVTDRKQEGIPSEPVSQPEQEGVPSQPVTHAGQTDIESAAASPHYSAAAEVSREGELGSDSGSDSTDDEYSAFERRFRELQALATQGTGGTFQSAPHEQHADAEAATNEAAPEQCEAFPDGPVGVPESPNNDHENRPSITPLATDAQPGAGPSNALASEPTNELQNIRQPGDAHDAADCPPSGAADSLDLRTVETTETQALEMLVAQTEALRARQEQFAQELERCEERLERLGRQFAQSQQPAPARTVQTVRRRKRRSPVWLGLRLFVLVVIGAVCWSWFAPGPLSKLLNVSDWRTLLGSGFGVPTVTGDDGYTLAEDSTLNVPAPGVFGNDQTGAGRSRALLVREPEHGTLQLAEDGSFQYTPDTDFHGADSFEYQGEGRADDNAASTVSITVTPVNDVPVASPDDYTVAEDQPLSVDMPGVLSNDADADGDTLRAVVVTDPEHGTVSLQEDGSLQYAPEQDFHGTDRFTYKAGDQADQSEAVTVTIAVEPVNDAPSAIPDSFSTVEDSPVKVTAPGVLGNDRDVENDPLTATVESGPEHGKLTLAADGSFHYMPHTGFSGTDQFTYTVSDGSGSATGTVTIAVAATNDPPTSNGVADVTDPDLSAPLSFDLSEVFSDPDGDELTYEVASNSEPNWVAATITEPHTLQIHFSGRTAGRATIRIRATDPAGEFAEETVRITAEPVAEVGSSPATRQPQLDDPHLATLTTAIELQPQDADGWKSRARRYGELGHWENAADDLTAALALDQRDRSAWTDRGTAYGELGQWSQAESDFAQAIALEPNATDVAHLLYLQALAALGDDDVEAYRNACTQAQRRSRSSAVDATSAVWAAWTCVLSADSSVDLRPLVQRTNAIATGNRGNIFAAVTLGALYYRAGWFDGARQQLEWTANRPRGSGPIPYDWFFLAMTYKQLGRHEEAQRWLQRAVDVTEQLESPAGSDTPLSWNRAMTLRLLRREAESNIQSGNLP